MGMQEERERGTRVNWFLPRYVTTCLLASKLIAERAHTQTRIYHCHRASEFIRKHVLRLNARVKRNIFYCN